MKAPLITTALLFALAAGAATRDEALEKALAAKVCEGHGSVRGTAWLNLGESAWRLDVSCTDNTYTTITQVKKEFKVK